MGDNDCDEVKKKKKKKNFWTQPRHGLRWQTKSTSVEICGEGRESHRFGESLRAVENDWLAREISAFLGHPQPANPSPQESTTFFENREKSGTTESQGGYSYSGGSGQSTYGTAPIPSTWNQIKG